MLIASTPIEIKDTIDSARSVSYLDLQFENILVVTMSWLIITEYLSQIITDVFRLWKSQSGPFLIQTYHRICNKSNTTDATNEARTAGPSGFQPWFSVGFILLNI